MRGSEGYSSDKAGRPHRHASVVPHSALQKQE